MSEFNEKRTWGPEPNYPLVKAYKRWDRSSIVVAGPCSVESKEQIYEIAEEVSRSGATHLRGGVFRAGTYPGNSFGLVDTSLMEYHQAAAHKHGLKNIMEVLDYSPESLSLFYRHADCFQVGSRQMQNYTLLTKVARSGKPVFLKRNQGSTLDEWLGSAEWLLKYGAKDVILIERGSSGFVNHVRWDLSISMIPAIKQITEVPIIVDAAHGTGRRDLVEPMTLAGVAAGADGLLCEVHPDPENSLSDPDQAITPCSFSVLMEKVNQIKEII